MKRVYVAGPYTLGDVALNIRNAMEAGNRLIEAGYVPYIPHLSHFQHMIYPQKYEKWLELHLEWVNVCDALIRLPGESKGADREVEYAQHIHKPVFFSVNIFLTWYNVKERP